jgi:hypothetical protein
MITTASYSRSHVNNKVAKLNSIFFRASGTPARVVDTLHEQGVCMHFSWASRALGRCALNEIKELQLCAAPGAATAIAEVHDNINLRDRAHSQRNKKQKTEINATLTCARTLPPSAKALMSRADLDRARKLSRTAMFPMLDLSDKAIYLQIESSLVHHVLRYLLDSADFKEYKAGKSPEFDPPPPVDCVDPAELAKSKIYVAGIWELNEATTEGNAQVLEGFVKACGWDTPACRDWLAQEAVIPLAGDGMTVERVEGLQKLRVEDLNGWDRLDPFVVSFGWFHVVMHMAETLHEQFLGTAAGFGINHAATSLKRKWIINRDQRTPWFHHLDELIQHKLEAHILDCYRQVARVDKLSDLKELQPQQLVALAKTVFEQFASPRAYEKTSGKEEGKTDQVYRAAILFMRDALVYLELTRAIRVGDVGRMENLIPTLLARCQGAGRTKYALHFLDLWQALKQEWNPALK